MPSRRASAAAATATSPPTADVADRLHSAAIHLLRWLRREDDESGLTAPRLSALSVVVFGGPVTLGALAAAEQVRPPTMTRIVAALEGEGLVTRVTDPADRRVARLTATAKGRRLLTDGRARRVATLATRIAALDADAQRTLAAAADILGAMLAR